MKNYFVLLLIFLCLLAARTATADQIPAVIQQTKLLDGLEQPTSVAVDEIGRVFVLDGFHGRVVVFSATGETLYSFGKPGNDDDGDLFRPMDLNIYGDLLVIADTGNERIAVFDLEGRFVKSIEPEGSADGKILQPQPVAVNLHEDGLITWSDRANHRICQHKLETEELIRCFGGRGETDGMFQFPFQMTWDRDEYLQIIDVLNGRVQVFDKTGRFFSQISRFGINRDELFRPNGVAIDEHDNLFVSDSYYGLISVFKKGRFADKLRNSQGHPVEFKVPIGLQRDKDRLYVVDAGDNSVSVLTLGFVDRKDVKRERVDEKYIEISQKNCVTCHLSWVKDANHGRETKPDVLPVASFDMCYSCHHGVVMDSRWAIKHGGQHPTLYDNEEDKKTAKEMEEREDELPEIFPVTEKKEMRCTTCHTPHNSAEKQETLYTGHENSWMRVSSKDGDLCERCHESKAKGARERKLKKRGFNHPLAIKLEKPPGKDEQGYAKEKDLHEGLPTDLKKAAASLDRAHGLICQSCHQIHGGKGNETLAVTRKKGRLCSKCHMTKFSKDKDDARSKGIHPVNVELEEPITRKGEKIKEVTCESCHKVHEGSRGTALLPNKAKVSEDICVDCHERQHAEDKDDALKKGIHPMNAELDDEVEIAGKKIKNMTCLSCHAVHTGKRDTPALVEEYKNGELCEHCHEGKSAVVGTDHDLRITAKKKENHFDELPRDSGVCGGCHTLHRGEGKQPHFYAAKIVKAKKPKQKDDGDEALFEEDKLCLNCHQEDGLGKERTVKHFSHPHKDIILRSDEKVMPVLDKDEAIADFGAIACITCHEPHSWKPLKPKEKPRPSKNRENQEGDSKTSFLRRLGVEGTFCVDCHSIEALPKYKYFHDKDLVRDIGVDYLK